MKQFSLILFFVSVAAAESTWTSFRGPNGAGVAQAKNLPTAFAVDKNLAWKTALPPGYSSPVLSGRQVFLTAFEGEKLFTIALDRASGKELWRKEAPRAKVTRRSVNTPVSATPATDGENVYVFFEDAGAFSYNAKGEERWRYAGTAFNNPYGMSASPILTGGKVILLCDQDTNSYLLSLDAATGKVMWKTERPEAIHGFSTPVFYQPKSGGAQVIVSGSYQLAAYSVESGEKLWWVWGMAWQAKSTPVLRGDVLYVHSWMASMSELGQQKDDVAPFADVLKEKDADGDGKLSAEEAPDPAMKPVWFLFDLNKDKLVDAQEWEVHRKRGQARNGLYAIRLGGKGDVTATNVLWKHDKSLPNIPSPVLYNDVLYVLKEGGVLTALDSTSGKMLKQGRITGALEAYFASPVAADGKIFTASKDGKVAALKAGPDWDVITVSDLGEEIWATPALDDNHVYIRTQKALYCFGKP
ncbi:MAG: PQQ-binding-like beta-propeller repeat protein [Acidobacteria bacterium]|nr:PQQ-binding-like beta-propeller repeat protein [Acidobacteriota bacterium]